MDEYFHAAVPRRLRVRSSVTIGQSRMPLRAFLIAVGCVVLAGLLITFGVALNTVVLLVVPLLCVLLVVLEATIGGRSCRDLVRIVLRHQLRPKRMRMVRAVQTLSLHAQRGALRPVRWLDHHGAVYEPR